MEIQQNQNLKAKFHQLIHKSTPFYLENKISNSSSLLQKQKQKQKQKQWNHFSTKKSQHQFSLKQKIHNEWEKNWRYRKLYTVSTLPKWIWNNYKAAGVIPHTKIEKTKLESNNRNFTEEIRMVLLAGTHRKGSFAWSDLGGKREDVDQGNPCLTALREFNEETGNLFQSLNDSIHERLTSPRQVVLWHGHAKYLYFPVEVPSEAFELTQQQNNEQISFAEIQELKWLPLNDVLKTAAERKRQVQERKEHYQELKEKGEIENQKKMNSIIENEKSIQDDNLTNIPLFSVTSQAFNTLAPHLLELPK